MGYQLGPWIEHYLGIDLLTEQRERLVRLYRLDLSGQRVVRRAGLRAPKGKGKSPEGGYTGFGELCGPVVFDGWDASGQPVGRPRTAEDIFTAWVQFAAVSEDQTDNVLVWLFDRLREREHVIADLGVDVGRTRIYLRGRPGRIEPVTAAAGSREGQPITFAVLDQTEAWKKENGGLRLANVMRRNIGKTGGWSYELQNAPEPGDGSVAWRTARSWEQGQTGVFFDWKRPAKIPDDLHDRPALLAALADVYGESTRWVNIERIADECTDADTLPSDAYRFYLNVERASEEHAFDGDRWQELADPAAAVPAGSSVVAGVDGARFEDALAIVATGVATGHQFVIGVWERPDNAPEDYEHPFEDVDGAMIELFERFNVWRVYCDPQGIDKLVDRWQGRWSEKRVVPWYMNRPRQVAWAMREYREAITAGDLSNDGDETMARHIRNAVRMKLNVYDDDHRQMWTIEKDEARKKIDAAAAGCISWRARGDCIAAGILDEKAPEPWFSFA